MVDLRGSLDFELDPQRLPGALRLSAEQLENGPLEIAPGSEVVLYCT